MTTSGDPMKTISFSSPLQWQKAYQAGQKQIGAFYVSRCYDWGSVVQQGTLAEDGHLAPEEVAEWRDFLTPFATESSQLDRLEVLTRPESHAVVTGQQAGTALGPLYTLYKALAAKAWAEEIQTRTGRPVVPVFWVASDDHDLAEVEAASWLSPGGGRETYHFFPASENNAWPVHEATFQNQQIDTFLEILKNSTVESEFRREILEALEESFQTGAGTVESHFLSLFCRWLLPMGIYPVVPRLRFIRKKSTRLLRQEINEPGESNKALLTQSEKIQSLGMDPPIHRKGNEVNFFLEVEGYRAKVVYTDEQYIAHKPNSGEKLARFSREELLKTLDESPGRFSPNAVLRPLVQDETFPTAAYIAGPTELVYHAQIGPLYKEFAVPRPAVFPRPNVSLLETKTEKAAQKLGLPEGAVQAESPEQLEELFRQVPTENELAKPFDERAEAFEQALKELVEFVEESTRDTGVRKAAEKLTGNADKGLEKLRERMHQHLMNQDADKTRAREKLLEGLFPGGELQERSIGLLSPLLIQHGPDVLQRLYKAIDYRHPGVQAISLRDV